MSEKMDKNKMREEQMTGEEKKSEEQCVAEEIQRRAEQIEVPESLQPEQVEKMLRGKKQKQKKKYGAYVAAACACAVIGFGTYTWYQATNPSAYSPDIGVLAETEKSESEEKTLDAATAGSQLVTAKDYEQIYEYLEAENEMTGSADTNQMESYSTADSAKSAASAGAASASADHSQTNTREETVGEADIIKTDGKYLYILSGTKVNIVDIQDTEMNALATISLDTDGWAYELYVEDDRMAIFYQQTGTVLNNSYETVAAVYDISDPKDPKESGKVTQAGDYQSMRMSDGYMYLFTRYFVYGFERNNSSTYIPSVNGALMACENIYLPGGTRGAVYTVVSTFKLDDPEKVIDSKAILTEGGEMYVSEKSIYLYDTLYYGEDQGKTCIQKVNYEKGELKGAGQTKLDGWLNDSFCIDESEGYLRLVMTVNGTNDNGVMPLILPEEELAVSGEKTDTEQIEDNCILYVLDENLEECGKIEDLAPGEQVYSARFMGDIGYFVTYEQIDPLFSVDLSDPKNPEIIGKLKIPGFSDYLHFYGEGLLLGIGMDMDESGVTSGGVKLSMFDISDPTDVKEIHKEVLEGIYSTNATYDYKTALVDPEKNLIGFNGYGTVQHYFVYSYGKEGFHLELDREITQYADQLRGVYAGERFYLLQGSSIESYHIDTFEKIDDIVL